MDGTRDWFLVILIFEVDLGRFLDVFGVFLDFVTSILVDGSPLFWFFLSRIFVLQDDGILLLVLIVKGTFFERIFINVREVVIIIQYFYLLIIHFNQLSFFALVKQFVFELFQQLLLACCVFILIVFLILKIVVNQFKIRFNRFSHILVIILINILATIPPVHLNHTLKLLLAPLLSTFTAILIFNRSLSSFLP